MPCIEATVILIERFRRSSKDREHSDVSQRHIEIQPRLISFHYVVLDVKFVGNVTFADTPIGLRKNIGSYLSET